MRCPTTNRIDVLCFNWIFVRTVTWNSISWSWKQTLKPFHNFHWNKRSSVCQHILNLVEILVLTKVFYIPWFASSCLCTHARPGTPIPPFALAFSAISSFRKFCLLIYLFSLLLGEMCFALTTRPFLVGGGVVIAVVIGYHIFLWLFCSAPTMICNTCSVFQAWANGNVV